MRLRKSRRKISRPALVSPDHRRTSRTAMSGFFTFYAELFRPDPQSSFPFSFSKQAYNNAMRPLAAISVLALFVAAPAFAQRGGGGHGGGFSGGHVGGFSARGGSFGGSHFSSGRSFAASGFRGSAHAPAARFSRAPYLHDGFRGNRFGFNNGFRGERFNRFGYRNCYGYGCWWGGYPGWYAGWWGPWWWNDDSSYDQEYYDNQAMAQQMNEQNLEDQEMLRREESDGDQDAYAPPRRPPQSPMAQPESREGAPMLPDTVLVFRDQHKQEVQNYAIVGQTLWAFGPPHNQKIALSDLDLPATVKANDDRGVTFRVPSSTEGQ